MMRAIVALLVGLVGGYVLRSVQPNPNANQHEKTSASASAPASGSVSASASASAPASASASATATASASASATGTGTGTQTGTPSPPPAAAAKLALAECPAELVRVQEKITEIERMRVVREGAPLPQRTDLPPRFQERPLLTTLQAAFKATGIEGRVDTVDCTEFPCIVYGRVDGDEELVAKLEDSKPFSEFDSDIGVMLTWASGDHAHEHPSKKNEERKKPSEISLFAFAFYTRADKAKLGDAIDRRIRWRTAELWNALHPDDQ